MGHLGLTRSEPLLYMAEGRVLSGCPELHPVAGE